MSDEIERWFEGPRRRRSVMLLVAALAAATLASACGTSPPTAASDRPSGATGGPAAKPPAKAPTGVPRTGGHDAVKPIAARRLTRLVFVDVGQGDAIVITSGSWTGLVDGGPPGSEGKVGAALRRLGVWRLSAVIVSHMHADHIGGLPRIAGVWRPRRAYMAGRPSPALARAFRRVGSGMVQVRRGDALRAGAARVRVLSPAGLTGDANGDSLVLLVSAAGKRFLLTGDCTGSNEDVVGSICARGPPIDVLKVSHHGSRYSTSSSFLAQTRPRVAVISVGPNSYGHPAPDALARLRAGGVRVFSTWKNGDVTFTVLTVGAMASSFSRSSRPVKSITGAQVGSTAAK
jgi:competence protein ComEC